MATSTGSSSSPSAVPPSVATFVPLPLPLPRYPAKFTSSLPCDELSALGHGDGDEPLPDDVLNTPRLVRNAVYSHVNPENQSKGASLLSWNKEIAEAIGISKNKLERTQWTDDEYDDLVKFLTGGGRRLPSAVKDDDKQPRLAEPWALCYGGHQFGYYAGQLGDGRAISLFETENRKTGESWELQIKGAGKTPYSRFADGYAVFRSSLREYLCAEAVAALGVASSRSLALLSTETVVIREEGGEPGSIVCRAAPSWVRFGNFEIFFYRKDRKNLRKLAEYVTDEVFKLPKDDPQEVAHFAEKFRKIDIAKPTEGPETVAAEETQQTTTSPSATAATEGAAEGAPVSEPQHKPLYRNRFANMFEQIAMRTAVMVSGWQSVGFCHGVINTDNMSVLGLTIDYGPYAFLDKYDPGYICNHSDSEGRYAFQQQPGICLWNLGKLALTLENLIGAQERVDDLTWMQEQEEDPEKEKHLKDSAQDIVIEIMNKSFRDVFLKDYRQRMNAKLGLGGPELVRNEDLTSILVPALSWMDDHEVDFHQFFRDLADYKVKGTESVDDNMTEVELFVKKLLSTTIWQARGSTAVEEAKTWMTAYHSRLAQSDELKDDQKRRSRMNKVNPAFVLRNWVAQKVIERATASMKKAESGNKEDDPDKDLLEKLLWMCQHPFGEDQVDGNVDAVEGDAACEVKRNDDGLEVYGEFIGPVPDWGEGLQCSCSS
ncbi:hypothetical protein BGZ99_009412 [Dissophora globulifera]|uniref:Selenoprotein O n=1 Tax=Dissophora globulifera TaxID=979702 RepID=A0A9P6RWY7_9FUNG|nr:hypothetical protein BGZ99_009412 [Dissophora globulifera]